MASPIVGHLDPYYLKMMDEIQVMLRETFRTKNRATFAVSGTGSAGQEATIANLVEPGDAIVIGVNGVFGERLAEMARRAGGDVTRLERPWGTVFSPEDLKTALAKVRPRVVAIVMAETSTGAMQPIEDIARLVHDAGALLLVDAVTALGGIPVEVDQWGIDAIYSGTQKCLSCPPGLAPVSFNDRAVAAITARKQPPHSWYLDVSMLTSYWGEQRAYHHTAPINMTYALHEALRLILEEGLDACFLRHRRHHEALAAGLAAIGIEFVPEESSRLPQLNAVRIPPNVDDLTIRRSLLERFGIEIGGGLGPFKGKVWRIGLMGHGARQESVLCLLAALETLLFEQKAISEVGAGVAAATSQYQRA